MTTLQTITIPLNKLVPSSANVRRRGVKDGIDELAASILAHGLRQNLNVRATDDDTFEVVAGGRRLRAMKLLAKQKKLAKDTPVTCFLLADADNASEISLAENVQRLNMHPLDEFDAYQALVTAGTPVEDVAARFGVAPAHVQRRLKLAAVAPKLRKLYAEQAMSLEQLMAFTVVDDHVAQERVWKGLSSWRNDPQDIRAALMGEALSFTHPLARFVGVDAYVAAGGVVVRDLFDQDNEGYFTDRLLLLRLVSEKLDTAAAEVLAEGWKWSATEVERDYSVSYGRVYRTDQDVDGNEPPSPAYAAEDMARAGVMVRVSRSGELELERGLIHPDDMRREVSPEAGNGRRQVETGDLPAVLVEDVTAHRSAALRLELASNPAVALACVVHSLALALLHDGIGLDSCLAIRASSENLERHVKVAEDSADHAALAAYGKRWADMLPGEPADLFTWCLEQPQQVLLEALAYLTALTVNAVTSRNDGTGTRSLAHADALAKVLSLDMSKHWKPSVEGFYGRLSKPTLIHLVGEAKAELPVNISALKKPEAARYVAEAIAATSWLPAPLRGGIAVVA